MRILTVDSQITCICRQVAGVRFWAIMASVASRNLALFSPGMWSPSSITHDKLELKRPENRIRILCGEVRASLSN
jgi:hypothetical protein